MLFYRCQSGEGRYLGFGMKSQRFFGRIFTVCFDWHFCILKEKEGVRHERGKNILAEISGNRTGGGLSALSSADGDTGTEYPPPHRRSNEEKKILLSEVRRMSESGYGNRETAWYCHTGAGKRREQ